MSKNLRVIDTNGSLTEIAELIKAISHEKRLQILQLVSDEAKDFSSLLTSTKLQKTALSNHLTKLLNVRLIKRINHGKYMITGDGRKLFSLISSFYHESSIRKINERIKLINRYSYGWKKTMEKKLTITPEYQPCWISYLGSVSGVMKALGKDEHDLVNTGGYTGYAFALPNVLKGVTCPSGPTALGQMWNEIMKGTEILGYKTRVYEDHKCYPAQEGIITSEDQKRATRLFEVLKKAIDNNEPVVLWGIPIPEYGIVTGYQDTNYHVSTYRRLIKQPDNPVAYDALQAPGALHAIIFEKKLHENTSNEDRLTLNRAITLVGGQLTEENYIAGANAYEEWASVLEIGAPNTVLYHGNSYVNECTLEARAIASSFLKRLALKYSDDPFSPILVEAATKYSEIVLLLQSFQKLFPFAFEGDLSEERRVRGAKLLRDAIPLENEALTLLNEAQKTWK